MALRKHGIKPEEITLHPGEAIFRVTIGRLARPSPFIGSESYEDSIGTSVVVDAEYGLDLGVLRERWDKPSQNILGTIVRRADMSDFLRIQTNHVNDVECREVFNSSVEEAELDMKLVGLDHSLDQGKITFYYHAEGRVDFRQLVRTLASQLHRRIELYQLNLHDQILFHPQLGPCGRTLCCCADPALLSIHVSSRLARVQGLSYNPAKMSGFCGKPRCCLRFEVEGYREFQEVLGKRPGAAFRLRPAAKLLDSYSPGDRFRVVEWCVPANSVVLEPEREGESATPVALDFEEFKQKFERAD